MQLRRSPCWCRRGTTIIYIVLVLPVMMGLIGLAADTANVYWTAHQLQNAGDAAALAGAQEVAFNSTTAISNAISTAAANRAGGAAVQLAASDVLVGNYNTSSGGFTANATPYNAVQVTARRAQGSPAGPLKLIFGPIVGISTSNVSRSAIAINDTGSPNGVIVLDPTASPAVQLTGTGSNPTKIDITNGNLVVDSNSSTAVQWSGNPKIAAVAMDLAGNDTGVNSGVYESGTAQVNQTAVADPLASLPAPAKPATAGSGNPLPPGYYPNGLGAGTLAGGIYWVDGGISLKSSDVLDASAGCLIYLHTGGISMGGNSSMILAPMFSGTYAGISIYEDRGNNSAISLQGSSGSTSTGRLYFPAAAVSIAGTPNSFGSQLICDTLSVQGNAELNINYDASLIPPNHTAYLVQ